MNKLQNFIKDIFLGIPVKGIFLVILVLKGTVFSSFLTFTAKPASVLWGIRQREKEYLGTTDKYDNLNYWKSTPTPPGLSSALFNRDNICKWKYGEKPGSKIYSKPYSGLFLSKKTDCYRSTWRWFWQRSSK